MTDSNLFTPELKDFSKSQQCGEIIDILCKFVDAINKEVFANSYNTIIRMIIKPGYSTATGGGQWYEIAIKYFKPDIIFSVFMSKDGYPAIVDRHTCNDERELIDALKEKIHDDLFKLRVQSYAILAHSPQFWKTFAASDTFVTSNTHYNLRST